MKTGRTRLSLGTIQIKVKGRKMMKGLVRKRNALDSLNTGKD